MITTRFLLIVTFAMFITAVVRAGQFNEKLSIGDAAPAWTDLPGTDGKKHSLADLRGKDFIIVVFTCNSCPVAVGYEDRIIALAKKYAGPEGRVAIVAINVNTIPEDRLDKMAERAKEKGFRFPYLYDETQKIAKDFGATSTPEFFVLNKDRKVIYMGAMDDRNKQADVKTNYLDAALTAALKGEKIAKAETQARGCAIRFLRKRR